METNTESKESLPLSRSSFALLSLGLGAYLGWQSVGISPTLFPQPHEGIDMVLRQGLVAQNALFLALLALFACGAYRKGGLVAHKPLIVGIGTLMCAGTALTYACGWVGNAPAGVFVGTVIGAVKAGYIALWGEALGRVRFRNALLCISVAYATMFALCLLVAGLMPLPALIVHAVLPLLSGGALLVLHGDRVVSNASKTTPTFDLPVRLFVGIGIFGALISLTNTLSETKANAAAELIPLVAGLALSVAFAVGARAGRKERDFTLLFRLLTPIIVITVVLVLVLESGKQQYEAFAIGLGWCFFRIFAWTLWCNIASRSRMPAACIFSVGQLALTGCAYVEDLAYTYVLPGFSVPLPVMASLVVVVAVITSTLIMSESDVRRFFDRKKMAPKDPADKESAYAACVELAAREYGLSKREEEITVLVLQGKNNAVIGDRLAITDSTLRTHLRNIYGKTAVHSRQELIALLQAYLED